MTVYIPDASIAVKWLTPEDHSGQADRLHAPGIELVVPDHFYTEVANALWSKQRRGHIPTAIVPQLLEVLLALPIREVSTREVLLEATRLASEQDHPVYDTAYVALAISLGCRVVTADSTFYRLFADRFPNNVCLIENLEAGH